MFNREPALVLAALSALLTLAVAFGIAVTEGQIQAILVAADALLTLFTGIATRQAVYSPQRYNDDVDAVDYVKEL